MVGGGCGAVRGLCLCAEGVAGLEHLVLVGLGDFDGDAVGVHSVLDDWGSESNRRVRYCTRKRKACIPSRRNPTTNRLEAGWVSDEQRQK